jgi:hypothetical protein
MMKGSRMSMKSKLAAIERKMRVRYNGPCGCNDGRNIERFDEADIDDPTRSGGRCEWRDHRPLAPPRICEHCGRAFLRIVIRRITPPPLINLQRLARGGGPRLDE